MSGVLVALQFLTRIPSPLRRPILEPEMGRSMIWFPLVGALVGALVGLLDLALTPVLAVEVRSLAVVGALALLTGALHLDGLMDSCDALFAFTSAERRLEILHDSHVGSFAVVGAATLLLTKYGAFVALPSNQRLIAFVAAGALSRWAMVYAVHCYPIARSTGLAHMFRQHLRRTDLILASLMAALSVIPTGLGGLLLVVAAWALTAICSRYTLGKIPGLTGDIYGAICEVVEVGVAIAFTPISALGWPSVF
ncbi:MAG TPA: adenosylcobinamide-GDP ribazoletransferase [Chloroflexota bacterium]